MWEDSLAYTFWAYSSYMNSKDFSLRTHLPSYISMKTLECSFDLLQEWKRPSTSFQHFCSYIIICWHFKKTIVTCFITTKRARTTRMCCLLSSMAIQFEMRVNKYFHDDRSTQDILEDFTFEIGLGTCNLHETLHFTWTSPKSLVNHTLTASSGSRVRTSPPNWNLFT